MARVAKVDPLDVKAKRFPRHPRIVLGAFVIVPQLDDDYKPIKDRWMVPGRRDPMSTDEVRDLAERNGLMFYNSGDRK